MSVELDEAGKIECSMAADANAIVAIFAPKLAASGGNLAGEEAGFAKARGPVWREGAVRRAGDGILIDALRGREETGDEVAIVAGRGGDEAKGWQGL